MCACCCDVVAALILPLVFSERDYVTFANCHRNSVCRLLSVTLVHPTQAVELFGNFFHHTIAQELYFSGAKNRLWGTPLSPEICVQSDPPPFKQRNFEQYRLIAPQP